MPERRRPIVGPDPARRHVGPMHTPSFTKNHWRRALREHATPSLSNGISARFLRPIEAKPR